jgi:hypothetical protein
LTVLELLAGERQANETATQVQACNDWLRLGAGRSLPKLVAYWDTSGQQPTNMSTLKKWSAKFKWGTREEAYDAELEKAKNARARAIMETGIALPHVRMQKLKKLERFLGEQIAHQDPSRPDGLQNDLVWVRDVKIMGGGEDASEVEIFRFNAPLIEQYRGALDDAAKETGGRKQLVENSGKMSITLSPQELSEQRDFLDEWERERFDAGA